MTMLSSHDMVKIDIRNICIWHEMITSHEMFDTSMTFLNIIFDMI